LGPGTYVAPERRKDGSPAPMRSALILHDDAATLAVLRDLLHAAGYASVECTSVFQVLLAEEPRDPRLVLLGMTAVDHRDLEVVSALRKRWPKACILVLFPAALRERAAAALDLGADGYLPEPFYPREFHAIVRRLGAVPTPSSAQRPRSGGVEQLAAGISHSIRNPLQILELQIGAAEADGAIDAPAMREQLRRITGVLDGLLRYSGRRDAAHEAVDVARLVALVFGLEDPPAGAPPAVVMGAYELLRAGFESLRDRAMRVSAKDAQVTANVEVRVEDGKRFVEVRVTDGGPALDDDQRAMLFEPYPDAAAVQDGTGLELAALAGIVRDHGGNVGALAASGGGTTILVTLPAADAGTAAVA
jgi:signal transduction histidine kinase